MAGMAEQDRKWQKMAGMSGHGCKWLEWLDKAINGWTWREMAGSDWKGLDMSEKDWNLLEKTGYCRKWLGMAGNG